MLVPIVRLLPVMPPSRLGFCGFLCAFGERVKPFPGPSGEVWAVGGGVSVDRRARRSPREARQGMRGRIIRDRRPVGASNRGLPAVVQSSLAKPGRRTWAGCCQRQRGRAATATVTERPRHRRREPPPVNQPHQRQMVGWGRAGRASFGSSRASIARGGRLTHPHGVQVR